MSLSLEFEELFSLFQDFRILDVKLENGILTFEMRIPWGDMWSEPDYRLTLRLSGCHEIKCVYYLVKSDNMLAFGKNQFVKDTEKKITSDPQELQELQLSVQSFVSVFPDLHIFHCIGDRNAGFAILSFSADNYVLFDHSGRRLSLDKIKQWEKDWQNTL